MWLPTSAPGEKTPQVNAALGAPAHHYSHVTQTTWFLAAFGKVVELRQLDDFVWSTLNGWAALPGRRILSRALHQLDLQADPKTVASAVSSDLRSEEEDIRYASFTKAEAAAGYPYLFSLAAVRLWAILEAASREVLVEALRRPEKLPKKSLEKIKGPLKPMLLGDEEARLDAVADAFWHNVEGQPQGVSRFDTVLEKIGLSGAIPQPIQEILRELSETRHCVVHRGGRSDRRFLQTCPWVDANPGDQLPVSIDRYWLHRTAAYWYVMELVRRWSDREDYPPVLALAKQMQSGVEEELFPAWQRDKRFRPSQKDAPN